MTFLRSLTRMLDPLIDRVALRYQAQVGASLKKYGLRVDDLLDPEFDRNIEEALRRLPQDVKDARMQRMKRAMDLSMKHTYLPAELQAQQTPFDYYLQDGIKAVEAEELERGLLGTGRSTDREIP